MKLRGRLALVVLGSAVLFAVVAMRSVRAVWDHQATASLRASVHMRLEHEGAAAFGTATHPSAETLPVLHAYAADFVARDADAPEFPATLRAELLAGAASASEFVEEDGRRVLRLALRTPERSDCCAFVLARQVLPSDLRATHDLVVGAGFVGIGCALVVLLAAGPVVARIRALADDVRTSAAERWAAPVPVRGSDEIADLAQAFNAAGGDVRRHIETLERRERTLREFVAGTDHDLTIPLTVLLGQLTDLRRRAEAGEPADPAQVRAAADEADYMASLVRNLGLAARIEAGEPDAVSAPVDLNALVERVVARHRPLADASGVALDFAVPAERVTCDGDETLLEQALGNLVHNAVRHHGGSGHVAVTLDAPRSPRGALLLRVADDGPGLSDDDLARLAVEDERAAAARSRTGRRGHGLRIVRKVAARHAMRFELMRRAGGGTVAELHGTRNDVPADDGPSS